jgi:hypothetical protein
VVGDAVVGAFDEFESGFAVAGGVVVGRVVGEDAGIADADAEVAEDDVVGLDDQAVVAEGDAGGRRGLGVAGDERGGDGDGCFEGDIACDMEGEDAWAGGGEGGAKGAGAAIVEVVDGDDFAVGTAGGVGAEAFGTGEGGGTGGEGIGEEGVVLPEGVRPARGGGGGGGGGRTWVLGASGGKVFLLRRTRS